jgi:hypothetical protein
MFLPLLVGIGVLLGSLLSYGMATDLIVCVVVRLIRNGYAEQRFWRSVAVMTIVTLITTVAHLIGGETDRVYLNT